jgi:collagen type I/II/III/V/XI/XXIV/XXVII alpha
MQGSTGGDAGAAAPGGGGGDASYSVSSLSEVSLAGTELTFHAYGGDGGTGGGGGAGGDGATAGDTTAGAVGGDGGDGTVSLLNSSISDQLTIDMQLAAYGGDGGDGGLGDGPGGFGGNAGDRATGAPWTATIVYAPSTAGGNGGAAGTGVTDMAGNTLAAPTAFLEIVAYAGAPGSGGAGGPAVSSSSSADSSGDVTDITGSPAGANGGQGQYGQPADVTITDNTITVSDDLLFTVGGEGEATITDNTLAASNVLQLSVALQNVAGTNEPLDAAAGGNLVFSGNSLVGGGAATLDLANAGTAAVVDDFDGLLALAGSPGNSMTGFSTFTLDSGATFEAGANHPQVVVVAPDPDTIVFTPGHAAVTLDDTTAANTLVQFQGYGATLDSLAGVQHDTTQSGGNVTIDIPGDGAITLPATTWSPAVADTSFTAPCFVAATRILACRGEVAVEDLRPGDRVPTLSGGQRIVRWIGRRTIDCDRHPRPHDVWPVRVAADAFGGARPARDLWLSPDHAVFVDNVLIPIRHLINGATVVQEAVARIAYFHVELDRHDILFAEGLPAESFLDTGNRGAFDNGDGVAGFQSGRLLQLSNGIPVVPRASRANHAGG